MSDDPAITERFADPSHAASRDYRINRSNFDSVLASVASAFITLHGDDIDAQIEQGMLRILEFLDLDRCTVIQGTPTRESDEVARFTHCCARPGFEPLEKAVVEDHFPWLMSQLARGEMVVFSRLNELPPEAAEDREAIDRRGGRSMAAIPFISEGEYFGAMAFTTVGREREWNGATIQRLHLTGQIFASVLLRQRAEAAARASAARLLAVARVTSDITFEFHADTRALDWLGDIDRLLGYKPGEFPRDFDGWQKALHPDDRHEIIPLVEKYILTGEDAFIAYRIRCKDGSYRNWEVRGTVVGRDSRGGPVRWAGACTDVTARLQAETDARTLREQLLHVSRTSTLGELTATLAHELTRPLTAILSNAQAALRLLENSRPDLGEIRDILEDIVADDQRAGGVIRHLRGFLKQHPAQIGPLRVNQLVRQVVALVKGELAASKVGLDLRLSNALPPVAAERFRLQQVILNLLMNAIEAMVGQDASRRRLCVRTSLTDGCVEISFSDTGQGIAGIDPDRLFDPFFTTKPGGARHGPRHLQDHRGGPRRQDPGVRERLRRRHIRFHSPAIRIPVLPILRP